MYLTANALACCTGLIEKQRRFFQIGIANMQSSGAYRNSLLENLIKKAENIV
jgi:hypothetical protein